MSQRVLFCSFSWAPDLVEHGHLPIQIIPPYFLQHLFFFSEISQPFKMKSKERTAGSCAPAW